MKKLLLLTGMMLAFAVPAHAEVGTMVIKPLVGISPPYGQTNICV